jgi:hypothetical protein
MRFVKYDLCPERYPELRERDLPMRRQTPFVFPKIKSFLLSKYED